jgi:hypothetical protein
MSTAMIICSRTRLRDERRETNLFKKEEKTRDSLMSEEIEAMEKIGFGFGLGRDERVKGRGGGTIARAISRDSSRGRGRGRGRGEGERRRRRGGKRWPPGLQEIVEREFKRVVERERS